MKITTGSVPKEWMVVNAMNVAAPQQVMLEVRFLEVNRDAGRDLGVNLFGANANGTNIGNTGLGSINSVGRAPIGGNTQNNTVSVTTNGTTTTTSTATSGN